MTNYSFDTSYEPFLENKAFNKRTQCDEVMAFIKKGANNLLQIAQGMKIPQEKPLISNLQFKQIHESLQRGVKTMYEEAQKHYSFESFQRQVLEQEYRKIKR